MTTATRDSRVPPQMPIKYVAKIRRSIQRYKNDCSTSSKPLILLMVHDDRGHFASLNENIHFDQVCINMCVISVDVYHLVHYRCCTERAK